MRRSQGTQGVDALFNDLRHCDRHLKDIETQISCMHHSLEQMGHAVHGNQGALNMILSFAGTTLVCQGKPEVSH
jgi:hypothetical protein